MAYSLQLLATELQAVITCYTILFNVIHSIAVCRLSFMQIMHIYSYMMFYSANNVDENKTDQFLGASMTSNGERFMVNTKHDIPVHNTNCMHLSDSVCMYMHAYMKNK